jgi:hypothetical protein
MCWLSDADGPVRDEGDVVVVVGAPEPVDDGCDPVVAVDDTVVASV